MRMLFKLLAPLALLISAAPACAPIGPDQFAESVRNVELTILLADGGITIAANAGLLPPDAAVKLRAGLADARRLIQLARETVDRLRALQLIEQARAAALDIKEDVPPAPPLSR